MCQCGARDGDNDLQLRDPVGNLQLLQRSLLLPAAVLTALCTLHTAPRRSLDAAVVSPGRPTPFPVLKAPPDLSQGLSFLLSNNIWGTNYPCWFPYQRADANMRFRFLLQLQGLPQAGAADAQLQTQGDSVAAAVA